MVSPRVLLITYSGDGPADLVASAIRERGATAIRFNTDLFPAELRLGLRQGAGTPGAFRFDDGDRVVDLEEIDVVWYRRFHPAQLPDSVEAKYVDHSQTEARTALASLFGGLRRARWVDPIPRVRMASHKVLQLEIARESGFDVPDTLLTNDPKQARAFFDAHHGNVVTKMLSSFNIRENALDLVVFTRTMTEEDFAEIDGLRHCPMVFQQKIPKHVELRVTVVGDELFVASIDSRKAGVPVDDWRRAAADVAAKFERADLPAPVREAVFKLMKTFGLVYGAIDIIRTPDGRHVFLEINPAGEWGWIQTEVGLPIADALADVLTGAVTVDRQHCCLL